VHAADVAGLLLETLVRDEDLGKGALQRAVGHHSGGLRHLDAAVLPHRLEQVEVDEDGGVDEAEIATAVDDLLRAKPYLAAAQSGKRFQGTADQGARKKQPVKTLADQIADAEKAGDWTTARRLKSTQLAAASNDQ